MIDVTHDGDHRRARFKPPFVSMLFMPNF